MRRIAAVPAVAVVLALAGCSTPSGGGTPTAQIVPPSATTTPEPTSVGAAWLDDGRLAGVVTYGSSTCVPAATDVALEASGTVTVTLADPDGACTKDLVPRVTLIDVPAGVDRAAGAQVVVTGDYSGSAELAGAAGLTGTGETDFLPSAGWTGIGEQLVVLTYGSSSCPPILQDLVTTGPASLTVTFQTPPADQICTADIAPRALVVPASGLETGVAAQLTLTGGKDFPTPVTIPVSGTT